MEMETQIFYEYKESSQLFPEFESKSIPEFSAFLGIVLSILLGLMALFEIISIYSTICLIKATQKIINKINNLRIPQRQADNFNRPSLVEFQPLQPGTSTSLTGSHLLSERTLSLHQQNTISALN